MNEIPYVHDKNSTIWKDMPLWFGEDRSMECLQSFFDSVDMEYLSELEAVAMDMNTSYNVIVGRHLPKAEIVYDRYHMQAQFDRDVLCAVRLDLVRYLSIPSVRGLSCRKT